MSLKKKKIPKWQTKTDVNEQTMKQSENNVASI